MNLNNITASIKPQQKWMIVVGLAVALFVSTLYLTLDTSDDKDHTYRPKVDKEVSVLIDTPSVRIGLDNLLGQLSHAESKIRQLEKRVQAMQAERDAMKTKRVATRLGANGSMRSQAKCSSSKPLSTPATAPPSTKTPRERQRLARFGIDIRRFGFCQ